MACPVSGRRQMAFSVSRCLPALRISGDYGVMQIETHDGDDGIHIGVAEQLAVIGINFADAIVVSDCARQLRTAFSQGD